MGFDKRRFYVRLNRMFGLGRDSRINREERCLMIIVRKLLSMQDTDLRMTPNMGKLYMRSGDGQVFVMIDVNNLTASVVNHHFGYDLKISRRVVEYVEGNFIREVEKQRMLMENEYMDNIQFSLSNVIRNLDDKASGIVRSQDFV